MDCLKPMMLKPYRNSDIANDLVKNIAIELPCGKCINCRINKANEWSTRVTLESQLYKKNAFVTLTYENENIYDYSYNDVQLFLKRLRKSYKDKIRYYLVGETGEKYGRIHYHAILFNYWPDDAVLFNPRKKYYGSESLTSTWGHGHVLVAPVTPETINYVCNYLNKGTLTQFNIQGEILPPFKLTSRRPGIGFHAFDFNKYKYDKDFTTESISVNGKSVPLPNYFRYLLNKNYDPDYILKKSLHRIKLKTTLTETKLARLNVDYMVFESINIHNAIRKLRDIKIKISKF